MRRWIGLLLVSVLISFLFLITQASAQADHIVLAAGTDEDHALQEISNEQDAAKKITMYQDFVQKFSGNPQAVAYGDWQLAQAYQASGDLQKALDYGDKALAASPHNLDILVSQSGTAQQAKNNLKTMEYSAKGGEVCQSIAKQPKLEGMSDDEFKTKVDSEKLSAQNSCEYLETSGY